MNLVGKVQGDEAAAVVQQPVSKVPRTRRCYEGVQLVLGPVTPPLLWPTVGHVEIPDPLVLVAQVGQLPSGVVR